MFASRRLAPAQADLVRAQAHHLGVFQIGAVQLEHWTNALQTRLASVKSAPERFRSTSCAPRIWASEKVGPGEVTADHLGARKIGVDKITRWAIAPDHEAAMGFPSQSRRRTNTVLRVKANMKVRYGMPLDVIRLCIRSD